MSGPLATDLIIAGVILLFALIGYFRGLIKSLMGLAATAASVDFAYVFSGQWAERVTGILFPSLSEDIAKSIDFSSMSVTLPVIGEVGLDRLGIDTAELTQAAAEKITAAAMGIMQPLVRVIVFLVLLILFVAATKIVLFLLPAGYVDLLHAMLFLQDALGGIIQVDFLLMGSPELFPAAFPMDGVHLVDDGLDAADVFAKGDHIVQLLDPGSIGLGLGHKLIHGSR